MKNYEVVYQKENADKTKTIARVILTEEDVEDIVSIALNGGIDYWAWLDNTRPEYKNKGKDYCVDEWTAKILMEGGTIYFTDEDEQEWEMDLPILFSGIRQYIQNGMDTYGAFTGEGFEAGCLDSEGADTIFQLALFGEVVYG